LERSGLCTFCLKHSAEFECYGRGGLSKPRCTCGGCDGEHTPNVHRLMGEDNAKVNLIAGDEGEEEYEAVYEARDEHGVECEYEWEYEDGGLWVGTVGAVEVLEWGEEAPCTTGASASVLDGRPDGVRDDDQAKQGSAFQVNKDPEEEPAENGWWDLEMECPSLEDEEVMPHRLSPLITFPMRHRGLITLLLPGSRGPERSQELLQIGSGRKPGRMPGSGRCLAMVRAARTRARTRARTKNDTGDLPRLKGGCRRCTVPPST
jgi:hypothetical protein